MFGKNAYCEPGFCIKSFRQHYTLADDSLLFYPVWGPVYIRHHERTDQPCGFVLPLTVACLPVAEPGFRSRGGMGIFYGALVPIIPSILFPPLFFHLPSHEFPPLLLSPLPLLLKGASGGITPGKFWNSTLLYLSFRAFSEQEIKGFEVKKNYYAAGSRFRSRGSLQIKWRYNEI